MKKVLTLNDAMGWQEAEKYITHLVNTYDKNKDGKFDYPGRRYIL